jgi:hypothetical protein
MSPLDRIHPLDQWTRNADRALGILFLKDPVRTSLGVFLGGALSSLSALFAPALQAVTFLDVSALSWWSWLAPGIVIMHIPTIVRLFKKPSVGSYKLDVLFELIERGNFSAAERRQLYRQLIHQSVEQVVADLALEKEEGALTERALD